MFFLARSVFRAKHPVAALCAVTLLSLSYPAAGAGDINDETKVAAAFNQQYDDIAVAFLDNYCTGCHSGDEPEAGFGLDEFERLRAVNEERDAWLHVVEKIRGGEMPPEDEAQPTEEEVKAFFQLIESELANFDCSKNQKPGRVTIRRLNRNEYNNTIRDLTGIDFQPAADFPADDVGGGFDNIGNVLSLPPLLMEKYLDAAESVATESVQQETFRKRWLYGDEVKSKPKAEVARIVLSRFATAAFRRPLRDGELESITQLFNVAFERDKDFVSAAAFAMQGILVSPNFLFRLEIEGPDDDLSTQRPLNDFELATRLSYFLWSSMPDGELFDLARGGKLNDPEVLRKQIQRMLDDPKSQSLVDNFAGQWLELRNLAKLSPDPEVYPAFDDKLRTSMIRETQMFFESVMRENRSLLEFIDSNRTFVNERLAQHYKIDGVEGEQFREVSLTGGRRGGILTHASILTLTSNPTRTSPVKRGKWILENVLGEPPPPPPPNVPELAEGDTELLGTLRERMSQHREKAECSVCHAKMDALGFGFENFDGIGAWREKDGRHDIDASGELPGNQTFRGPSALRQILKTTKTQQFVQCLSEKMLTYALGRELGPDDRCTIETIVNRLDKNNYEFVELIMAVVESDAFQIRGAIENDND